jgi:class 3 adenylate cyclase/tetratricopeptide (TPR) repeat protein
MERKLATVLFVDLVDSTALVAANDPEIVRRRVSRFFDEVSQCVTRFGGIVEKFAGDAVLAAFGVPQAHEDDAERAVRAALAVHESVRGLGLQARIGIEAGEVVVDEADSTFATGEAVNVAARLQQTAGPGEILIGPGARGLTLSTIETESRGTLELRGLGAPLPAWRVVCAASMRPALPAMRAPLIGRESELELLRNTFSRTLRDKRAHLFTIYGEPGIGKSRLAREFVDGVERATVLAGRCLPYGEGITYWPLAEMVKQAAGISDDDPPEVAFEKLRASCEEEAVADLLGLAAGLLEALEGERSPEEITWAAREFAEHLGEATGQPLILVFEDIHWAEEPLLDLIEHLADWVRAPLLLLCLARPELLDSRPGWGGGRVRATAIELERLGTDDSEQLVEALLEAADRELSDDERDLLLEKTEGNPLFVEETIRMLADEPDGGGRAERIPDTLQALIAARIDWLPPAEKTLLQRASVMGRIFVVGALAHLAPELDDVHRPLEDLLLREFLLPEPRSSISGETAYRFKHVLIREVAYAGLSKSGRAEHHRRFAEWLRERASDDLLEIRAYHLDHAAALLAELDGAAPQELAAEAAEALTAAGRRAIAREAFASARKLLSRAIELEPTLRRRYLAARAAWRLNDWATVAVEMERVRNEAQESGDTLLEARALTGLGEAELRQSGDVPSAERCIDRALELLQSETDPDAHFDALIARSNVAGWRGDTTVLMRTLEEAFAVALASGRKDLQTIAAQGLAETHMMRLELDAAEPLLAKALELAEESGSVRALAGVRVALAGLHARRGEYDEAEAIYEDVRELMNEIGNRTVSSFILFRLAEISRERGDLKRAEKLLRESSRIYSHTGSRAVLAIVEAFLALVLAELGKVDEAEVLALRARSTPTEDPEWLVCTRLALGVVRAAQGRVDEAEILLREALGAAEASDYRWMQLEPLRKLAQVLRAAGRDDEAAALEERRAELAPALSAAQIA